MSANSLFVQRSQLIDIGVPAGYTGTTINIQDQPMLRDKRITGIEVYTVNDMPVSPISGNAVAGINIYNRAFLNAYTGDPISENDTGEFLYRYPLVSLHNQQNSTLDGFVNRVTMFDYLILQWEKCSITFASPITFGAATSFMLNVYYTSGKRGQAGGKVSGIDMERAEQLARKIMSIEDKIERFIKGSK